jgi:hypothetical protein
MNYNKKTAYIMVKTHVGYARKVFEQFKTTDWVIGTWLVSGDYDLIVWVNAKNEDEVYNYAKTIKTWEGIYHTNSYYVYDGNLTNFEEMTNLNGAWVRVRGENIETMPEYFNKYDYITNWACIPGDFDYMVWFNGKTHIETMDHILNVTENHKWHTYTHLPVTSYMNNKYKTTL